MLVGAIGVSDDAYRRILGPALGGALGLVYGLASQLVNSLAMPGIPYSLPPLGPAGNIGLSVLWGAVLGLLTGWPGSATLGIVLGSVAAALAFVVRTFLLLPPAPGQGQAVAVTGILLLLPVVLVNVPAMIVLRWALDRQAHARRQGTLLQDRVRAPLLMALAVALAGGFTLLSADARADVARMDRLVQAGLSAGSSTEVPAALRAAEVGGFLQHARGQYTLRWTNSQIDRFGLQRPATNFENQAVVVAQFENRWTLVCLFASAVEDPVCRGFTQRP